MRVCLITFKKPFESLSVDYLKQIQNQLEIGGIFVDNLEILPCDDEHYFKFSLQKLEDSYDAVIILDGDQIEFDVKSVIANCFQLEIVENQRAKEYVSAHTSDQFVIEEYSKMPFGASVIPNADGVMQGFLLDEIEFSLFYLPGDKNAFTSAFNNYVVPFFENKFNFSSAKYTLKYFGNKNDILQTLYNAKEIYDDDFEYLVKEQFNDVTINLFFNNLKNDFSSDILRYVLSRHKDNIYAEKDVSLATRLFELLTVFNLKISTAESFTSGKIISAILENSGASKVANEGVVAYSNQSKIKRLNVLEKDLQAFGAVSQKVAEQMAFSLLNEDCDVSISTTGIAGPNSDGTDKPVGLCYIGIGTKKGVYAYKYNLKGTREEITETAKNIAIFLAIKNIKKLNLGE